MSSDRELFRHALRVELTRDARAMESELPPFSDGSCAVVVVFADEPVGPVMESIVESHSGNAHLAIAAMDFRSEQLSLLSVTRGAMSAHPALDLLAGQITFGMLLAWTRELHDGFRRVGFVDDSTYSFEIGRLVDA